MARPLQILQNVRPTRVGKAKCRLGGVVMKSLFRSLMSLVLGVACTAVASAEPWCALDRTAIQLESHAQALLREVQIGFRHTASYPALLSKAGQLNSHACQFHAMVQQRASRQALDRTLRCMDDIYCDLEDGVFDAGREARWDRHCHVDTRTADRLLKCVDNTIHQLENMVDDLRDCDYRPVMVPQPVHQRPVIVNPNPYPGYHGPDYGSDYSLRPNVGPSYRPNYDANRPSYGSPFGGTNSPRPGVSFGSNGLTLGNGITISFGR